MRRLAPLFLSKTNLVYSTTNPNEKFFRLGASVANNIFTIIVKSATNFTSVFMVRTNFSLPISQWSEFFKASITDSQTNYFSQNIIGR